MTGIQKVALFLTGLITASISLLAGGFLGSVDILPIVIALIPISLGRILFGKQALEFAEAIYGVAIIILGITHLPIMIYPEIYEKFYLTIYTSFFGSTEGAFLGNLDAALSYEPILACLAVFTIIYAYKEGYIAKIYRKV
jgi:hypothetical protein